MLLVGDRRGLEALVEPMSTPQTSSTAFNLLFMQLAFRALEESRPMSREGATTLEEQPDHEAAFYKIERLGFQVGQRLIERLLLQTQAPRMTEQIDAVKYLCKEFWTAVFDKGIDNLKTNHRGIYVLQDHNFQWISLFSADPSSPETARMAVLV